MRHEIEVIKQPDRRDGYRIHIPDNEVLEAIKSSTLENMFVKITQKFIDKGWKGFVIIMFCYKNIKQELSLTGVSNPNDYGIVVDNKWTHNNGVCTFVSL